MADKRKPRVVVRQEPDDPLALRVSIGGDHEVGYYLVIRGDPTRVLTMIREVAAAAEKALPVLARQRGPQG